MKIEMGRDADYQTRDGRSVRILAVDGNQVVRGVAFPVIALHANGAPYTYQSSGGFLDGLESDSDIIERPRKFRYERWVNEYPDGLGKMMFNSKIEARQVSGLRGTSCVKVIIEGAEGDGLD